VGRLHSALILGLAAEHGGNNEDPHRAIPYTPRLLNPRGFPAPADGDGRRAIHAFPTIIGKLIADDLDVDDPHTGTRN
jgi:hypothetical protein